MSTLPLGAQQEVFLQISCLGWRVQALLLSGVPGNDAGAHTTGAARLVHSANILDVATNDHTCCSTDGSSSGGTLPSPRVRADSR